MAVVSAPALGRRWWAALDRGAFAGTARLGVSSEARLERSIVGYTTAASFGDAGIGDAFSALVRSAGAVRGYGNFLSYMLVASGQIEAVVEPAIGIWDVAAPALIVSEAGGTVSDVSGRPDRLGGSIVASNGHVHDELLAVLARSRPSGRAGGAPVLGPAQELVRALSPHRN